MVGQKAAGKTVVTRVVVMLAVVGKAGASKGLAKVVVPTVG